MAKPDEPIRVYSFPLSGHAHRVRLFLALLGLPHRVVDVDLAGGAHRAEAFLAKNPFGQVPVLEDGGLTLADSNAILVYLAECYDEAGRWYPREPERAAAIQRWLSVAAGELNSGPGAARLAALFGVPVDADRARDTAARLFGLMEQHLAERSYLVEPGPTIADIALYSYTALAPEGGVPLAPYPAVQAWLRRFEALPGFVPTQPAPAALAG